MQTRLGLRRLMYIMQCSWSCNCIEDVDTVHKTCWNWFHLRTGETAAASGLLEREAVFLMCAHAAQQPSDIGLVGAALDMLAARLTYPSRSSLLAFHMRALIFDWCSHDYSIQQFLAVQVRLPPPSCLPLSCTARTAQVILVTCRYNSKGPK